MNTWKTLLGTLCLAAVGSLAACDSKSRTALPPAPPTKDLTILTPHNEAIRNTFARGFSLWYAKAHEASVRVHWVYRSTPDCLEYVRRARGARDEENRDTKVDLMFGGGVSDYELLAREGLCRKLDLGDAAARLPEQVSGFPTKDPGGGWVATALSTFGVLENRAACEQRGIAAPQTWTDLADPRFFGWVAVADPSASGSHREAMLVILQQLGWDAGHGVLVRVLANARALNPHSTDALAQVGCGASLATFAVNFDGLAAAARNPDLHYFDPPGGTTIMPDGACVLTTAGDVALATDFIRYALSEQGQLLWAAKRDQRDGFGQTLYHHAILPEIYEKHADQLAVSGNPFQTDFGLKLDLAAMEWEGGLIKPLVQALCRGGNHIKLQATWRALIDAGLPAAPLAEFSKPLWTAAEAPEIAHKYAAASPADAEKLVQEWSAQWAERLAKVREMLGK